MGKTGLSLLLALLPAGVLAAPVPPPVAKPAPASQPIAPPPAAAPARPEDQTPRFTLTAVTFEGVKAIPAERLAPAWAPFAGRPVSLADLGAIARAAEAIYARNGYPFVAVVLNPQAVAGGAVRYTVIEGHVSSLTVLGADPVARRQATAAFAPLVDMSPLPASAVEGAYEHARLIPGLAVAGALH
ncbi:MAG TPA: POTRA domain-containing protein, partial [Caulobacteraceae bacterium]|nr:POTRA domain-containing protein [Caulobacteraceae bacterium]